jgi:lysophospholipase L1-like esterase
MKTCKRIILAGFIFVFLVFSFEFGSRYYLHKMMQIDTIEISAIITLGKIVRKNFQNIDTSSEESGLDNLELSSFILSESELENRLELFAENSIGIANSPYDKLINEKNSTIKRDEKIGLVSKSNTIKYVRLLKSRVFNPWDPLIYNSFEKEETDKDLQEFVGKYALSVKTQSTDEKGYRTTLPKVNAEKEVIVLGDSVAFGASLSDEETISSQLQAQYKQVRFVNDSIGQGTARDNFARLASRLEADHDKIAGVIYVHTENDYTENDTPKSIMTPLAALLKKYKIPYQAIVHQVYIYQSMPDLFRGKYHIKFGERSKLMGRDDKELLKFFRLKNETLEIARENQINVVDFYEIVDTYRYDKGTPFAGLSLYVDHAHFSREGVEKVVEKIKESFDPFIKSEY